MLCPTSTHLSVTRIIKDKKCILYNNTIAFTELRSQSENKVKSTQNYNSININNNQQNIS